MKTDEQILLNYMYLEGYTDEEMHNPIALGIVRKSLPFSMHLLSFRMKVVFHEVGQTLLSVFNKISEELRPLAVWFEELHENMEPAPKKKKNHSTFQKLERNQISRLPNQVTNNKPRHKVRKIIR